MRIVQLVPFLTYGDAVGNDVLALHHILQEFDAETRVYVQAVDTKRIDGSVYSYLNELPRLDEEDVIFYHVASGSPEMVQALKKQRCRRYIIYHNITPPEFFSGYSEPAVIATKQAFDDMEHLRTVVSGCLADSEFNRNDLSKMGYDVPMAVLPIVVPFEDYAAEPSAEVLARYAGDDYVNILFVGRIAPNKKQEDIIKSFYYYKKYVNPKSRLFLVGNWNGQETYFDRLQRYAAALGVEDIVFSGHIAFKEILAYYHLADIFLCMSEHEGFCVPLLEAMYFHVPILAYDSTAIPYTLRGAGLVFSSKEPAEVAYLIDQVIHDETLRQAMLEGQQQRLEYFSYDHIANTARSLVSAIVEGKEWSAAPLAAPLRASGELQTAILQEASRTQSKEELLSFAQIPVRSQESLCHRILAKGYRAVYSLCPSFADKVKFYIKRHILS